MGNIPNNIDNQFTRYLTEKLKAKLIGKSTDASTADTIWGAKNSIYGHEGKTYNGSDFIQVDNSNNEISLLKSKLDSSYNDMYAPKGITGVDISLGSDIKDASNNVVIGADSSITLAVQQIYNKIKSASITSPKETIIVGSSGDNTTLDVSKGSIKLNDSSNLIQYRTETIGGVTKDGLSLNASDIEDSAKAGALYIYWKTIE